MIKNSFLFLFSILACCLYAQKDLHYLRLLHYSIESPASIHLQGRLSAKAGIGFALSNDDQYINDEFTLCFYTKLFKFAVQYKQEDDSYNSINRQSKKLSLNRYFKIRKKKDILSFGLGIKMLKYTISWDEFKWADQVDPTKGFTKPTYEIRVNNDLSVPSFDFACLYYNTKNNYFAGVIINDLTEPNTGFYGSIGAGTSTPREIKLYGGYNYGIVKHLTTTSTLLLRSYNIHNDIFVKQDLIYKNKYWAALETNLKSDFKIFLGIQPYKGWRWGLSADIQPNPRSVHGNSNFYKLSLGYALF